MASPIGHALLGWAVGHGGGQGQDAGEEARKAGAEEQRDGKRSAAGRWLLPAVAALAAVAPDLDFLPGVVAGDPNQYHQLHSHTLVAALSVGLAAGLVGRHLRLRGLRVGVVVGLAYASHLLLDFFTHDPRPPFGIPLVWPVSSEHFAAPWPLFRGIRHGVPGQGLGEVLDQIFSLHNLVAVGIEVSVTLPVLLLGHVIFRRKSSGRRRGA